MAKIIKQLFPFLFLSFLFFSHTAFCEDGTPDTVLSPEQIKSIEVIIEIYQTVLAISGALLAYFLTQGKSVLEILRKKDGCNCGFKISFFGSSAFLFVSSFLVLWDMATISNQLRNNFFKPEDLFNDNLIAGSIVIGLLLFIVSIYYLWKTLPANESR